ncbi:hypothetical protein [Streptosporangium sp. NPDC000396]|uniref:hypothetical protein n=1 Tax=Streptosporangium sp. NPDC000396 TaxID=3366185 RepID=UPI0036BF53AA
MGRLRAARGAQGIELPQTTQRAMARQAEAEREKHVKIIATEGEALSAGRLAEAADVIADHHEIFALSK